jgi:hypothetical protein
VTTSFDPLAIAAAIRKLAPTANLASDSRRIKLGDVFFFAPDAAMPPTAATSSMAPSSRAPR